MYLEDFRDRIAVLTPGGGDAFAPADVRTVTMLCGLLADLATELLPSRPTRPGGAAEEARTPRRMEAVLGRVAEARRVGEYEESAAWVPIDAELRAMGFLRADAGGEP